MIDLTTKKDLIEENPMHIATVSPNNEANLAVASDVRVLDKDLLVISHNEMKNTPKNIKHNSSVVVTSFNKDWEGLRITGEAEYFTSGEYVDFCKKEFFGHGEISPFGVTEPQGAILVKAVQIEEIK